MVMIRRGQPKPPRSPIEKEVEPLALVSQPPVLDEGLIEGNALSLFEELYPEFGVARWQSPIETEKILNLLTTQMAEDPIAFFKDLYERGNGKADQLVEILGVDPQEVIISNSLATIYPDMAPDEFVNYLETDFPSFVSDMTEYTDEKAALLKQLGYTKVDIDNFYGTQPVSTGQIPSFDDWITEKGFSPAEFASDLRNRGVAEELIPEAVAFSMAEQRAIYEYEHDLGRWGTAIGEWDKVIVSEPERIPDVAKVFGQSLLQLPQQLAAAVLTAAQGQGGASVVDKDWADRFIEQSADDLEKFTQDIAEQYPNSQLLFELSRLSQNLNRLNF